MIRLVPSREAVARAALAFDDYWRHSHAVSGQKCPGEPAVSEITPLVTHSERSDCYNAIESLLLFVLRNVPVPNDYDVLVFGMDKASSLGDHVSLLVPDMAPDSRRISKSRKRHTQHDFGDTSRSLEMHAVLRGHFAIEAIVYNQTAAKKRILER